MGGGLLSFRCQWTGDAERRQWGFRENGCDTGIRDATRQFSIFACQGRSLIGGYWHVGSACDDDFASGVSTGDMCLENGNARLVGGRQGKAQGLYNVVLIHVFGVRVFGVEGHWQRFGSE